MPRKKDPGIAAVLAFLWPGAGYIYCGRFALMAAAWATYAALLIIISAVSGALSAQLRGGEASAVVLVGALLLMIARVAEIVHAYRLAERTPRVRRKPRPRGRARHRRMTRQG